MIIPRHMKPRRHRTATFAVAIVLAPLCGNMLVAATPESTAPPAVVPQSVFVVPTNAKEGRDPFYPKSPRVFGGGPVTTTPTATAPLLIMNGISGAPGHRTVMVNGRTMAEGETSDVPITGGGLVKVHCVEIKDASVVIEVGGVRQELFFRGAK